MIIDYILRNYIIHTFIVLSIFSNFSSSTEVPSVMEVKYHKAKLYDSNNSDNYYELLLKLALEETKETYGEYKLIPQEIEMVQERSIAMLQSNLLVDVIWTMTSLDREKRLQAVYFPLLKGLLGYRLFLIRKGEQDKFNGVHNLDELKKISLGQGVSWPDTQILKSNHFTVVTALGNNLHNMLEKKRFDLFPRSILEITDEANSRPNLTIESGLLLKYMAPLYFFVNKKNTLLAERLTVGLYKILENGKFNELFYSNKGPSLRIKEQNIKQREVIEIKNPNLSSKSEALLNNASLWFL